MAPDASLLYVLYVDSLVATRLLLYRRQLGSQSSTRVFSEGVEAVLLSKGRLTLPLERSIVFSASFLEPNGSVVIGSRRRTVAGIRRLIAPPRI